MRELLSADLYRMFGKRWFRLAVCFMEALSIAFLVIQKTGMDHAVALDRVIFLPMSFYGIAAAALIGFYVGDDFHDGMIRNKLAAGRSRMHVYWSAQIVCWLAGLAVYTLTVLTTALIGSQLFAVNIAFSDVLRFYLLGVFTCIAYISLFCMASMLCKNRSTAVVLCMASAFAMLFLCLHTNQVLVQEMFKNGAKNPAYVDGIKRVIYLYLHDLNPCGQAAQLSSMHCFSFVRFIIVGVFYALLSIWIGANAFRRADIG